jgi:opacity protein-like surface antigen
MKIKYFFCTVMVFLLTISVLAQDSSLLRSLNDSISLNKKTAYVFATFKAGRIINMRTVESPGKKALVFLIQHRFGQLNSGAYNLFGLDNATLRLGFDYGISDRLAVGIGRSSYQKTFDGYIKYKLLRQTDGTNKIPISVSLLGVVSNYTIKIPELPKLSAQERTSYATQILIARKFSSSFSLQLVPSYLYYNYTQGADKNNVFAIGAGGRMKITKRMSIDAEYTYLPPNQVATIKTHNSFSLGWGIETGGHMFQLVFTNSQSMIETQVITQTTGNWSDGGIYFGFNLSRVFNLKKKK